jgi:hypothetical protein
MDDAAAVSFVKSSLVTSDSEKTVKLKERLEGLLREAAAIDVELSRADGSIRGIPHYSVIEGRAHQLGMQLSREVQRRQMSELAASQALSAKCPTCKTICKLETCNRALKSVDGTTDVQELVGYCPGCRRSFFPSA